MYNIYFLHHHRHHQDHHHWSKRRRKFLKELNFFFNVLIFVWDLFLLMQLFRVIFLKLVNFVFDSVFYVRIQLNLRMMRRMVMNY